MVQPSAAGTVQNTGLSRARVVLYVQCGGLVPIPEGRVGEIQQTVRERHELERRLGLMQAWIRSIRPF
jgi:hypothetical protein